MCDVYKNLKEIVVFGQPWRGRV